MKKAFLLLFCVFFVSHAVGQEFIGESGLVEDLSDDEWKSASFNASFDERPYVFATTQTDNGGQDPSGAHVRDVTMEGFQTQHCEYDGGDNCDTHTEENNAWFAVDPSVVEEVQGMDAGKFNTTDGSGGYTVEFDESIERTPLIFTNVQTENGNDDTLNTQAHDVTPDNATVEFCEQDSEDGCDSSHAEEEIAWLAVDPSIVEPETGFEYGNFTRDDSRWAGVSFSEEFTETPMVIADVQTESGTQEALYPEVKNVNTNGADVRYCESDGGDGCDNHNSEEVAWLSLEPGEVYVNVTGDSLCDRRGPINECIADSQRQIDDREYDINSIFISEASSEFEALNDRARINVSNISRISGLWRGSFDILSEETRLVEGAKLSPGNGRIKIS